jgi:hypothetical protein
MAMIVLLFQNCTFGSIGNSDLEKLTFLQNLITLRNNSVVSINSSLQFFDNQADDNLNQFSFSSAGSMYDLSISSESYVIYESGTYRFNPPDRLFGILNNRGQTEVGIPSIPRKDFEYQVGSEPTTKTHTPYTVPLDLPITDIYGKSYSFLVAGKEMNFSQNNLANATGAAFQSQFTKVINDSPTGLVSLATVNWKDIFLNVSITRSGITKNIKVLLGPVTAILRPKCKLSVDTNRKLPIAIGIQYSNLFRDYVEGGRNISFLQSVFTRAESEIVITSISNTDLLSNLLRNFNTEDLVVTFPGCLPGVLN